jgi:Peptidase A4 family
MLGKLLLISALLALPALANAGEHGPIRPYLDAHGHGMRGLRNTYTTGNWSGYAVGSWQSGQSYFSATMTWQVPGISYVPGSGNVDYLASWVGIGGFCQNADCSAVDQTLIQLGTAAQVSAVGGEVQYYPWYELLPNSEFPLPYVVKPGDLMTASLECTANCTPGATQTWSLAMSDQTRGWIWPATNFQYQSGMSSVDAITEAPYSGGILPLASYTGGNFDQVLTNGVNPGLTLAANGIIMMDPAGGASTPSPAAGGNQFSSCYGTGTCPASQIGASSPSLPPPPAAPVASLIANPTTVNFGQAVQLIWSSMNATACAGTQFSASGTAGATEVLPLGTTTYIVTCAAPGEPAATASATVTVKRKFFF